MKLSKEDKIAYEEYLEEITSRKKLTKKEVEDLIELAKKDAYTAYRSLIQNHFVLAHDIAKNYHAKELTILDLVHAANEGLESGVVSNNYNDYDSFIKCIEEAIKYSIELMLSFLNEQ